MTKSTAALLIAIAIPLLTPPQALTAQTPAPIITSIQNPPDKHDGVYATSQIQVNRNGTATTFCSTDAYDPLSNALTPTELL